MLTNRTMFVDNEVCGGEHMSVFAVLVTAAAVLFMNPFTHRDWAFGADASMTLLILYLFFQEISRQRGSRFWDKVRGRSLELFPRFYPCVGYSCQMLGM